MQRWLSSEFSSLRSEQLPSDQGWAYRIEKLSNADISRLSAYRWVYRIEPPISSNSIFSKPSDFLSFSAENSPKIQKIPENSENTPKIQKIRRKFLEERYFLRPKYRIEKKTLISYRVEKKLIAQGCIWPPSGHGFKRHKGEKCFDLFMFFILLQYNGHCGNGFYLIKFLLKVTWLASGPQIAWLCELHFFIQ